MYQNPGQDEQCKTSGVHLIPQKQRGLIIIKLLTTDIFNDNKSDSYKNNLTMTLTLLSH